MEYATFWAIYSQTHLVTLCCFENVGQNYKNGGFWMHPKENGESSKMSRGNVDKPGVDVMITVFYDFRQFFG
jgi:hypothetical protein